ncbi:hypothetical protein BGZ95_004062 [Linnemannia exigua]|uniref:Uncharacterized protein n=1 Tax=Linnemannia exigua TaxID=604196 RepID=A0AAD4D3W2_9FUNG|nr:hypothetical protein BGZ95_004062 [Linnemannia exigua]
MFSSSPKSKSSKSSQPASPTSPQSTSPQSISPRCISPRSPTSPFSVLSTNPETIAYGQQTQSNREFSTIARGLADAHQGTANILDPIGHQLAKQTSTGSASQQPLSDTKAAPLAPAPKPNAMKRFSKLFKKSSKSKEEAVVRQPSVTATYAFTDYEQSIDTAVIETSIAPAVLSPNPLVLPVQVVDTKVSSALQPSMSSPFGQEIFSTNSGKDTEFSLRGRRHPRDTPQRGTERMGHSR